MCTFRVNGCAFIQEIKMAFRLFFTENSTLLVSMPTHLQSRFGPGTSQPESRDKPIGNAPETLYTADQGFSEADVMDARSSLNDS